MLKEKYNLYEFNPDKNNEDLLFKKINQQPLRLIEPTYSFLRGFYDGIFCEQNQFELDYDYLKGFYEGVKVRKPKNG